MISIQTSDFDAPQEYEALRRCGPDTGAIVTFTGLVRDRGDMQGVTGLFLEHYPGMTESVLEELIKDAQKRWELTAVRIIHRVGQLSLQDQIVFVGVCSAHRSDAFAACAFLMDALKTSAPFWKKEMSEQGEQWVEQKESDLARGDAWKE